MIKHNDHSKVTYIISIKSLFRNMYLYMSNHFHGKRKLKIIIIET